MDPTTVTAITTAFSGAATSIVDLLGTFVPIIAGVAVAGLAIKFVPRLIKRIAGSI